MMQIEAGKYYRTRDGRKVGPANARSTKIGGYRWGIGPAVYDDQGRDCENPECVYHLVSEWIETPVRKVTRKEIVPGLYSHIRVWPDSPPGYARLSIQEKDRGLLTYDFHPSELRAAADVLNQLADALEPKP